MIIIRLALESVWNRRLTALLTILSIAMSVVLLLGVEKIRSGARDSFINTISGTDLIVGARSGGVQLLLYSVFRIGNATNNISWQTLKDIEKRPEVDWLVPISLGDSHRGYRVMGTSAAYFDHYRYRRKTALSFQSGTRFDDLFEAVIGSRVAQTLGYKVGDKIIIAHGSGKVSLGASHDDDPFIVSGILKSTGTPVDRTVHVSLAAIEAIHKDWQPGIAPREDQSNDAEAIPEADLVPKAVTAAYIGLKSKIGTFSLQRFINDYRDEPITAILPGVAFAELWTILGTAEKALIVISSMVVFTAFLGMVISILGSLNERRREMAILRAVGARASQISVLFIVEAATLALAGIVAGIGMLYLALIFAHPVIETATGIDLQWSQLQSRELTYLAIIGAGGIIAGIIPAIRAYQMSLSDGLSIRI